MLASMNSDVEVVNDVYAAMTGGDVARLFELFDEDCVITQDPRLPWGGRHVGHDGLATFGLLLREAIQSSVTTDAVFAADGDVIQVGRTAGTTVANGHPVRRRRGSPLDDSRRPRRGGPLLDRHPGDARRARRAMTGLASILLR